MKHYNCDFHIHIGSAMGKPIKITASRRLTIESIIEDSLNKKGMDIIGLVDCASPYVLAELTKMLAAEELTELEAGGLSYQGKLTILLGSEVETQEGVHVVCYFPDLTSMITFSELLATRVTNHTLSTQRARVSSLELLDFVTEHHGLFMPAHIFTPHKSYYGKAFDRLENCFGDKLKDLSVVELGLSSDTNLADRIQELHRLTFLTNSDAHSTEKIAREFNVLQLGEANFDEIKKAFLSEGGRGVIANYGLDPKLGKYFNTFCVSCDSTLETALALCENCGSSKIVKGVYNRILELEDLKEGIHPSHRPQYFHQVPLEFIPRLGKKGREKAVKEFGSEINVLHFVEENELKKCLESSIVDIIIKGRMGSLNLKKGGGGFYGKVMDE